jgi:formyltetrahydrofolate deformylase
MRMVFYLEDLDVTRPQFERAFQEVVANKFVMEWRVAYADQKKRMAVMVSKYDHCLLELLWRWRSGELNVEIPFILSNHEDLRGTVEAFGLSYHHIPMSKETKEARETETLELLRGQVDFIVLARYMQILSSEFIRHYPSQIINIHHSFLPAFVGAHPYKHAYERGVKLIGATGHYVTEELDQGPIIEQDVRRVSHRDGVRDLVAVGREIERAVLARAVAAHVEDRVIAYENKTIVFE